VTLTLVNLDTYASDEPIDPLLELLMAAGDNDPLLDLVSHLKGSRPAWHADALCHETPGVNFFPERGEPTAPAVAVCSRCIVQPECLAWAAPQTTVALVGIWGGSSHRDRRAAGGDVAVLAARVIPKLEAARRARMVTSTRDVCLGCGTSRHALDDDHRCQWCAARAARIAAEAG
jgi:WhiB family transcriptional regulator, redox-sensing transcriptional regulator